MSEINKKLFVANRKTKKYHFLVCPYAKKIFEENRIELGNIIEDKSTLYELQDFEGCKYCNADIFRGEVVKHSKMIKED